MSASSSSPAGFLSRHKRLLLGAVASVMLAGGLFVSPNLTPTLGTPAAAQLRQDVRPTGFADLVERVKPAVVAVQVTGSPAQRVDARNNDRRGPPNVSPNDPLFRFMPRPGRPGGDDGDDSDQNTPQRTPSTSQGSGFFVSADGYVVTNNHVVKDGSEYTVIMDDGKRLTAKLIGVDERTDLAVLKVDGNNFPFVKLSKAQPRIGDWVVAIGNPFGLGGTVTAGIVSARGRDIGSSQYDDYIQIDAPVNRGNSGGPTFNLDGEVIGINTAIYSPTGGSVGIGFAIPATLAEPIVTQIETSGTVTRGWLGVRIQPVTEELAKTFGLAKAEGALVAEPQAGSPAARAGIRAEDVIVGLNGETVKDARDLTRRVATLAPGSTAKFDILRKGERITISVEIGKLGSSDPVRNAQRPAPRDNPADVASLGLTLSPGRDGEEGVVIQRVMPRGPGSERGLRQGDVILSVGGDPVSTPDDVRKALQAARDAGKTTVQARIRSRGDQTRVIVLPIDRG